MSRRSQQLPPVVIWIDQYMPTFLEKWRFWEINNVFPTAGRNHLLDKWDKSKSAPELLSDLKMMEDVMHVHCTCSCFTSVQLMCGCVFVWRGWFLALTLSTSWELCVAVDLFNDSLKSWSIHTTLTTIAFHSTHTYIHTHVLQVSEKRDQNVFVYL